MKFEDISIDNKFYRIPHRFDNMFVTYPDKGIPIEVLYKLVRETFDTIVGITYYNPLKKDNQVRMTQKFNEEPIISKIKEYLKNFDAYCLYSDMITSINNIIRANRQLMRENHQSDETVIDDSITDVIYNIVDEYRELLEKEDPNSKQFTKIIYEMDNVVISEIDFRINNIHEIQKVIVNRLKELKII